MRESLHDEGDRASVDLLEPTEKAGSKANQLVELLGAAELFETVLDIGGGYDEVGSRRGREAMMSWPTRPPISQPPPEMSMPSWRGERTANPNPNP